MSGLTRTIRPSLTVVVTGRNDNYGGDFDARLFRSVAHNGGLLAAAGVEFEYLLAEWNPLTDEPLLSQRFVATFPWARAIVIDGAIHRAYARNAAMPFFEMPAKNAAIRRARGEWILVTNGDILFDDALVARIAAGSLAPRTFYRAHRIDVPPELPWPELKDPDRQLASGEGRLPPPYYLGAGGDFALASRDLWLETTGFNEVIRWTTRAKDWQFFLGIAARGIPIAFIGDVYHLDHETGFRNTAAAERNAPTAHFGGMWDFEFGVPVSNRRGWGGATSREELSADDRILTLHVPADGLFARGDDEEDGHWEEWLSFPQGRIPASAVAGLYACLRAAACRRALIVELEDSRSAVAIAGLAQVAHSLGVEVYSEWQWPPCGWMRLKPFARRRPERGDLVLSEHDGAFALVEPGGGEVRDLLPGKLPVAGPEFNPFLCRRLLRAWLRCHRENHRRIALFGAGGHTRELLSWGLPDSIGCCAVLSSQPQQGDIRGIPIVPVAEFDFSLVDAVVLSSVPYEGEMMQTLATVAPGVPVIPLYVDWPRDL